MTIIRLIKIYVLSLLIVSGIISYGYGQTIIVHKDNPVNTITVKDLNDIYFGRKSFWNIPAGPVKIRPVINNGEVKYKFFLMINANPWDFQRHWFKMIYSGVADSPKTLKTDDEVLQHVADNKGSIGFVTDGIIDSDVKILKVIP